MEENPAEMQPPGPAMREGSQWREQRGPGEVVGFLSVLQKQTWTNKYMRDKQQ